MDSAAARRDWLEGFRYRVAIRVDHSGTAVDGYQVKVTVPAAQLVAAGKLRADGADVRFTMADGVTALPYWIESGVGTDEMVVWTRIDLSASSPATAWLYYGNTAVASESSLGRTFVAGVIDDPAFDRADNGPWLHVGGVNGSPSPTNEWSATLGGGQATIRIVRKVEPNGAIAGICQSIMLPSGSRYRFVFHLAVAIAEGGSLHALLGGMNGDDVWPRDKASAGASMVVETRPVDPGPTTLCLAGMLVGRLGSAVEGTFSTLHLRREIDGVEPAVFSGAEQVASD